VRVATAQAVQEVHHTAAVCLVGRTQLRRLLFRIRPDVMRKQCLNLKRLAEKTAAAA